MGRTAIARIDSRGSTETRGMSILPVGIRLHERRASICQNTCRSRNGISSDADRRQQTDSDRTQLFDVGGDTRSPEVVANVDAVPEEKEKLKRLTLDIPDKLHRAIKGKAALEGKAMVDMLRELLEEKYGNL